MSLSLTTQNFASMYGEVGRIVQDSSTTRRTSIKDALNRALGEASEMFEWPQLLRADESGIRASQGETDYATFIASDPYAVAPVGCGRIKALVNQTAGGSSIEIVSSERLYEAAGSGLLTVGKPCMAAIVGRTAQYIAREDDSSAITATCPTDVNDNIKTLRVYLRDSRGQPGEVNWLDITGSFGTLVSISAVNGIATGYPIEAVAFPDGWLGSVEIQSDGGTLIANIAPPESEAAGVGGGLLVFSRPLVRLWPVPDVDYAATWIWWRVPHRLVEDGDIPEIPVSSFLVAKAAAEIFSQMGKEGKARMWEARAATYLSLATNQNTGTKRVSSVPYAGNVVGQTGSGARWGGTY